MRRHAVRASSSWPCWLNRRRRCSSCARPRRSNGVANAMTEERDSTIARARVGRETGFSKGPLRLKFRTFRNPSGRTRRGRLGPRPGRCLRAEALPGRRRPDMPFESAVGCRVQPGRHSRGHCALPVPGIPRATIFPKGAPAGRERPEPAGWLTSDSGDAGQAGALWAARPHVHRAVQAVRRGSLSTLAEWADELAERVPSWRTGRRAPAGGRQEHATEFTRSRPSVAEKGIVERLAHLPGPRSASVRARASTSHYRTGDAGQRRPPRRSSRAVDKHPGSVVSREPPRHRNAIGGPSPAGLCMPPPPSKANIRLKTPPSRTGSRGETSWPRSLLCWADVRIGLRDAKPSEVATAYDAGA